MLGSQNIELLPQAVNDLLIIQLSQKKGFPEIERVLAESEKRALEMARRAVARNDSRFVESIQLLGEYFDGKKDLDRAEWLYRQALVLLKQVPNDPQLSMRLIDKLVALLEKKPEPARDPALYRELLQFRRESAPKDEIGNLLLELYLGLGLTNFGQFEEAERVLVHIYRSCLTRLGKNNSITQVVARSLITLYTSWGNHPEKIAEYNAVLVPPSDPFWENCVRCLLRMR